MSSTSIEAEDRLLWQVNDPLFFLFQSSSSRCTTSALMINLSDVQKIKGTFSKHIRSQWDLMDCDSPFQHPDIDVDGEAEECDLLIVGAHLMVPLIKDGSHHPSLPVLRYCHLIL